MNLGTKSIFMSIFEANLIFALLELIGVYSIMKNLYSNLMYLSAAGMGKLYFFWYILSSLMVFEKKNNDLFDFIRSYPDA